MSLKLGEDARRARAALKAQIKEIERPEWLAQRAQRKEARAAMTKRVGKRVEGQRQVRETDSGFLAYLRRCPCAAQHLGGCSGPIEAAHVRYSDASKGAINPGMQRKNHDKFANSLCRAHHQNDQHTRSEQSFWASLGKDAYDTAAKSYAAYLRGDA
ncbi:MAG: hypothetical protein ACOVKC_06850 [Brevundimonas sp.]